MRIEESKSKDEVVLCAGLPSEGERPISKDERDYILGRRRNQRTIMALWLLGIPLWLAMPFIFGVILNLTFGEADLIEDIVFVLAILSIVIGIPASIYFADLALKRYRVLRRTLSAHYLRRFEGTLDDQDWTSSTHSTLRRAVGAKDHDTLQLGVDLHAADDVLFKIDDRNVDRWIAVELTRAARPPDSPARFRAPIEWSDPEREDGIVRRRLTTGEIDEISGYARLVRRRRWWQLVAVAWLMGALSRLVGLKIFELESAEIFLLWVGTTAVVGGGLFYHWTSAAELYDQDRMDGWVLILEPSQASTLIDGERNLTHSLEVLPMSGVTWSIGGTPASWRKRQPPL
jgi:hypothetical protein